MELDALEAVLRRIVEDGCGDSAHDILHIERVVSQAKKLALAEKALLDIVVPAAWLHDCVAFAKDSPLRSQSSRIAAKRARELLMQQGYPSQYLDGIEHAIVAHSFSAGILPQTIEARVLQDADRIDALGAVGIARCFMTGGGNRRRFYSQLDPFCTERAPDDSLFTLDHFYSKLLRLEDTMQTEAGRKEARVRAAFICEYLERLKREISS